MDIVRPAIAGTLESSDCQVTVEKGEGNVDFSMESSVINQYGNQIRKVELETLKNLGVSDVKLTIVDKGALDCTIKARIEAAVYRSVLQTEHLPWGGISDEQSEQKRLRRTMMFLNAQKPGLIKDPYIYKPDSIMLDLEDAVAENQKDAARFSLYHALKTINYRGCERVVRINGLDSPYWKEDIRCSVAGGCDSIRIPKTESAQDVKLVEREIAYAEKEFGRPEEAS